MFLNNIEYSNNNFSNWILRIALFFSVFAFSSYNNNVQSATQESTQSELVISSSTKKINSVFTFNKYLTAFRIANNPVSLETSQRYFQLNFNLKLQVRYMVLTQKVLTYKSSFEFVLRRISPLNSEDNNLVSL